MSLKNVTMKIDRRYVNASVAFKNNMLEISVDIFQKLDLVEYSVDLRISVNDELNFRTVFKRNINLCKFLNAPRREIMLNIFYQELLRQGHWPQKCPFEPVNNCLSYYFLLKANF